MSRYLCPRVMSFSVIAAVLMTLLTLLAIPASVVKGQNAAEFDIVLANGRVMDPESNTDAVRYVGILGDKITAISASPLRGRTVIDAKGLVIVPGFIDLHSHGQDDENYRYKARDGVTTALEMEVGVSPVAAWYAQRGGREDQKRNENQRDQAANPPKGDQQRQQVGPKGGVNPAGGAAAGSARQQGDAQGTQKKQS